MSTNTAASTRPHIFVGMPIYESITPETFEALMGMRENVDATFTWEIHKRSSNLAGARAKLVTSFLATDATHMLFCDGDGAFKPDVITRMLASERDLIGCWFGERLYTDMNRIRIAVLAGDPDWWRAGGSIGAELDSDDDIQEVEGTGTGLLLIRRHVLEHMVNHFRGELAFQHSRAYDGPGAAVHHVALFQPMWLEEYGPIGEDTSFAIRAREAGFKIHLLADADTWHVGAQPVPYNALRSSRADRRIRETLLRVGKDEQQQHTEELLQKFLRMTRERGFKRAGGPP